MIFNIKFVWKKSPFYSEDFTRKVRKATSKGTIPWYFLFKNNYIPWYFLWSSCWTCWELPPSGRIKPRSLCCRLAGVLKLQFKKTQKMLISLQISNVLKMNLTNSFLASECWSRRPYKHFNSTKHLRQFFKSWTLNTTCKFTTINNTLGFQVLLL